MVCQLKVLLLLQALQFEHRDMHRGNVLVRRTHEEYIYFRLDGVEYSIKSYGALATIVDYTLSRVKQGIYVVQCYHREVRAGCHSLDGFHQSGRRGWRFKLGEGAEL